MFMKNLILLSVLLVTISSLAATGKTKFTEAGIRAGMTKDEVTYTLAHCSALSRFLIGGCTHPGTDRQYLCKYDGNKGDYVRVFFLHSNPVMWENDPMVGFAMTVHYEGSFSQSWKLWYDDISKQLGSAPTKQEDNPDEYTLKHAEWIVRDARGKQVEKVRLDAMTGREIMIFYDVSQ